MRCATCSATSRPRSTASGTTATSTARTTSARPHAVVIPAPTPAPTRRHSCPPTLVIPAKPATQGCRASVGRPHHQPRRIPRLPAPHRSGGGRSMRGRHGLQVTMLALTGQKRLYYKLFSEWSGYSSGRPTMGRTREATRQRRGRIEYLAIVQSAAEVEFYSVVVVGIRAPEEDVDMGVGGGSGFRRRSRPRRDSQPTRRLGVNSGA